MRALLRARIAAARRAANPLLVELDDEEPTQAEADPLMEDVTVRVRAAFGRLDHFIDGYLAGEGGQTLVVQVYPPGAATSLDDDQRLFAAVSGVVRALDPPSFHPSIRVGYGGEVRGVIENQENLVRDLLVSSILVLTAVSAVLVLYYRSWRSIPLLVLPLFTGVAATFAVSRWIIHYLNPNTAFLGSIIVGNGINAGIILLARYFEGRRRVRDGAPPPHRLGHRHLRADHRRVRVGYVAVRAPTDPVRLPPARQPEGADGGSGVLGLPRRCRPAVVPDAHRGADRLTREGASGRGRHRGGARRAGAERNDRFRRDVAEAGPRPAAPQDRAAARDLPPGRAWAGDAGAGGRADRA